MRHVPEEQAGRGNNNTAMIIDTAVNGFEKRSLAEISKPVKSTNPRQENYKLHTNSTNMTGARVHTNIQTNRQTSRQTDRQKT